VVEWVKEVERDSWASFKTRRNTARAKQLRASSAACVAARAVAARRGGAGRGPARCGGRRARALEGTWRGEERRGAVGAREMAGEGGVVTASRARVEQGGGTGGRRRRTGLDFSKNVGAPL
jgi:hypothetical protein